LKIGQENVSKGRGGWERGGESRGKGLLSFIKKKYQGFLETIVAGIGKGVKKWKGAGGTKAGGVECTN